MSAPVKVLVLCLDSISHVVMASPVVRCLKQQVSGAEVHFCTRSDYESIVSGNPYIDKRYFLDNNLLDLIRQLRSERYAFVIDLQQNLRTQLIKGALRTRSFSVDERGFRAWFYVRWKINMLPNEHLVDRFMQTVRPLGVENDDKGLDYFIPYKDEVEAEWLPATHRHNYVAYAIGGQHRTKRLPLARMIELCQKINHPIILLGDANDRQTGEEIVRALGDRLIYNACGLFNINQSASLLKQAGVVFSHDTGLMHIAAAFRKKIYTIWGSTTPQLGAYPYKTPYVILEKKGLQCRPCTRTGRGDCPLRHFKCMNGIAFDFDMKEMRPKKKNFD